MSVFVTFFCETHLVILREKGRCRLSRNLLIRAAAYDIMRERTVLPLHQIKTAEREIKRTRMVRLTNTPGEDDGCRLNPYSSSGIYMTAVKDSQCRIVVENRRKQDEIKKYDMSQLFQKGNPYHQAKELL